MSTIVYPPMLPGPWNWAKRRRYVSGLGGSGSESSTGFTPDPGQTYGRSRSSVPQVPRAPLETDNRLRPHIDKVARILNSLFRQGFATSDGRGNFQLIGGGAQSAQDPGVGDDRTRGVVVGMNWVNTATHSVFVCINNSIGSAVWVQTYP